MLQGAERWDSTAYFHPWTGTLGYNEGFLLFGLPYAAARALSLDPFVAETVSFIVMRAIGFVFFLLLARQAAGLGWFASLLGAALVTIASNAYVQSAHGQLLAASLAPLFCWLLWRASRAVASGRVGAALGWGWGAALLFGAWLLTGFYTAWFTVFLLGLGGLAAMPFVRWRALLARRVAAVGAAIAVGFAVAAVPVAWVYLPKARETGMHGFGELLYYSPSLLDWLHVGRSNLLFGGVDGWLEDRLRPGFPDYSERAIGFGPALLALGAAGAVLAWRDRSRVPLRFAAAAATIGALALATQVEGHTLWYYIYSAVPGAGAVRVVSRIALVVLFPLTMVAMLAVERLRRPWLVVPLAVLLVAEELNGQNTAGLDRPAALAFLASVPPAPGSCGVFFVRGMSPGHATGLSMDADYPHNTDAMLLASLRRLPTINGISTFNPPDWELRNSATPGYVREVRAYLERHGLVDGVCGLDLETRRWSEGWPAAPEAPALAAGVTHPFGDAALDPILGGGWEGSGPVGRWTTASRAKLYFARTAGDLSVEFYGLPFAWNDGGTSPITLLANGHRITTWRPVPGRQTLRAVVPAALLDGPGVELTLDVERPRSPSELGLSEDRRQLGFFVLSVRIDQGGG